MSRIQGDVNRFRQIVRGRVREELRKHLGRIKRKFRRLYGHKRSAGKFAMEVEFKVTAAGKLAIKQARPWVY